MLLTLTALITFPATTARGALQLRKPASVRIESSWQELTDRAEIQLAKAVSDFDNKNVQAVFRKGDPVTIELGYNGRQNTEFQGFITQVGADYPVTLYCQDAMWKLKQSTVNISFRTISLPDLLKAIVPAGYSIDALDIQLGAVRFSNTTVAQVLKKLQDDFSLYSYMKGNTLVCGKIYQDDEGLDIIDIHLEKDIVSSELEFEAAADTLLEVKAISVLNDGTKKEVTVGDKGGDTQTLTYFNIEDISELKRLATIDLEKQKKDRLSGGLIMLGQPSIQHGRKVRLYSDLYPERNGVFDVKRIETSWGHDGFRRKLQIGNGINGQT